MPRRGQLSLRKLLLAFILIATVFAVVFSSGLLKVRRTYLVSHLGTVDGEKRSVKYGLICYTQHRLLPGKRIEALIIASPKDAAEVIANGKVVEGTWNTWRRELVDGQPKIGFTQSMYPYTRGKNVHQVNWRIENDEWRASTDSEQIEISFDQAMMFLQIGESEEWNLDGLKKWLESGDANDVAPFPPPSYVLKPKRASE